MKELFEAFRALRHAPRALWLVIFAFSVDAMVYFGLLPLMKPYLTADLAVAPAYASTWVSVFTGGVSVTMLFVGKPAEQKLGIRGGILLALALVLFGRIVYGASPFAGGLAAMATSIVVVAFGEGLLQPIAYAGVKRYTDEKNGAMGYALLYAFMNLGAASIGPISAAVRTSWDAKKAAGQTALSGFNAVNWVGVGISVVTFVVFFLFMSKRAAAVEVARKVDAQKAASGGRSPFFDPRFMFFIFMLLPVRTLFAHQWLTMPEYVLRAYPQQVADRMEWLVDSINPIIIFFGVPIITAITKRYHVLSMMITGTLVSAAATFLLCTGPRTSLLIAYFFVFSIGEAFWSSRFYEYSAELAPPGRVAQYMGIASLPWFIAKTTTGFYSGFLLEKFCPAHGPKSTETLWLIYGVIAMATPMGLLLARKWLLKGMSAPRVEEPSGGELPATAE